MLSGPRRAHAHIGHGASRSDKSFALRSDRYGHLPSARPKYALAMRYTVIQPPAIELAAFAILALRDPEGHLGPRVVQRAVDLRQAQFSQGDVAVQARCRLRRRRRSRARWPVEQRVASGRAARWRVAGRWRRGLQRHAAVAR